MPFRKVPGGGFVSPSGKHWTTKQVKLYYATDGFSDKARTPNIGQRSPKLRKPTG